jgi:hypothetical protein
MNAAGAGRKAGPGGVGANDAPRCLAPSARDRPPFVFAGFVASFLRSVSSEDLRYLCAVVVFARGGAFFTYLSSQLIVSAMVCRTDSRPA